MSQGDTVEEALANLREATVLFLEERFLADGDPGLDAEVVLAALEQSL